MAIRLDLGRLLIEDKSLNQYKKLRQQLKKEKAMLFFDIETSPNLVWTYPLRNIHVLDHGNIEEAGKITHIAYKFEGHPTQLLTWDFKKGQGDDTRILTEFHKVISQAKVIVGQNSDNFDIKWLRWRLNMLNLPPLSDIITLDTLKLARQSFYAPTLKLDYRSQVYGLGGKIKQDMGDCIAVAKGDKKATHLRGIYNKKDVEDTAKVFWKELSQYKKLPFNLQNLLDRTDNSGLHSCGQCGEYKFQKHGIRPTLTGFKQRYRCMNCGHCWTDTKVTKR